MIAEIRALLSSTHSASGSTPSTTITAPHGGGTPVSRPVRSHRVVLSEMSDLLGELESLVGEYALHAFTYS